MRRFFILFSLVILSISAYAIDKQVLADSLTAIVHQHAFAGKVDVSRIRVKNQYVHVYTNATLSHISLTPKEVSKIRMMVSMTPRNPSALPSPICVFPTSRLPAPTT